MRVKNTTKIDSELVREVIAFVRPAGISNFDVMIKNSKGDYRGKAYPEGSGYHTTANPFVIVALSDKKVYPTILRTYQIGQIKGRRYWLANINEALVYVMAHELRHIWQGKAKSKRGYMWGARGRYSEIDTESYAIKMLRAWRNKI